MLDGRIRTNCVDEAIEIKVVTETFQRELDKAGVVLNELLAAGCCWMAEMSDGVPLCIVVPSHSPRGLTQDAKRLREAPLVPAQSHGAGGGRLVVSSCWLTGGIFSQWASLGCVVVRRVSKSLAESSLSAVCRFDIGRTGCCLHNSARLHPAAALTMRRGVQDSSQIEAVLQDAARRSESQQLPDESLYRLVSERELEALEARVRESIDRHFRAVSEPQDRLSAPLDHPYVSPLAQELQGQRRRPVDTTHEDALLAQRLADEQEQQEQQPPARPDDDAEEQRRLLEQIQLETEERELQHALHLSRRETAGSYARQFPTSYPRVVPGEGPPIVRPAAGITRVSSNGTLSSLRETALRYEDSLPESIQDLQLQHDSTVHQSSPPRSQVLQSLQAAEEEVLTAYATPNRRRMMQEHLDSERSLLSIDSLMNDDTTETEDYGEQRSDLLQRGRQETARAVETNESHVVECQGCGGRLHAPVSYALVYCTGCGVVSPGQSRR